MEYFVALILKDEAQLIRHGHAWKGQTISVREIYVMWDEENLYIAADIIEDTVFGAIAMLPLMEMIT